MNPRGSDVLAKPRLLASEWQLGERERGRDVSSGLYPPEFHGVDKEGRGKCQRREYLRMPRTFQRVDRKATISVLLCELGQVP